MSVQVIYKNKAKLSDLGVIALFGNEKFQVQNLRSSFSKIETSYIEKISKNIIESISILVEKKLDLFSSTVNNK